MRSILIRNSEDIATLAYIMEHYDYNSPGVVIAEALSLLLLDLEEQRRKPKKVSITLFDFIMGEDLPK